MNGLRRAKTVLLILMAVMSCPSFGASVSVPSDFPTIQAALQGANNGDTIVVEAGTYHESISFGGKKVILQSKAGPLLTVIEPGLDAVAITFNHGETVQSELRGFTIKGANTGVRIVESSPSIVGNFILDSGAGIYCNFASPVIRSNTISGTTPGSGITIGGASTCRVENNIIERCASGMTLQSAGSPVLRNNIIRHNSRYGIQMENRCDADIIQNVIIKNGEYGIFAGVPSDARGPHIQQNTIAFNAEGQEAQAQIILSGYFSGSMLANNIIVGSSGISCEPGPSTPPQIRFNNVFSPDNNAYSGTCPDQTGISGNISAAPLFLNPDLDDYRLISGSPGIDAANAAEFEPVDLEGNARPADGDNAPPSLPDMGAFEFIPGPPRPSVSLFVSSRDDGALIFWKPFDNSISYRVSRSTNISGPYTPIGSTTETNFVDLSASLHVINYYALAGSNSFGFGMDSSPVAIRAANSLPVGQSDDAETDEDTSLSISPLSNDSDPDNDPISLSVLGAALHGSLSVTNNLVTYEPAVNFFGADTFTYVVEDLWHGAATGQVNIIVKPVNDPPRVRPMNFNLLQDTPFQFDLGATDVDSSNLVFQITVPPEHGLTFINSTNGHVEYRPAHGFLGTDSLMFSVSDGFLSATSPRINLTVLRLPDSDRDGLPDSWETTFKVTDPALDQDNDGLSNLAEYMSGTSPTDPGSVLRIQSIQYTGSGLALSWSSIGGVRYRILSSDKLPKFTELVRPAADEIDPGPYGLPSKNTYIDTRPPSTNGATFYRLEVIK
jgi:parallel beta-helix repeat protein